MKTEVYNFFQKLGFHESIENRKNNKRLGVSKSFVFENLYAEIVNRDWGFSIQIYGGEFQKGYYPSNFDVCVKSDLPPIFEKITNTFNRKLINS